MSRPSVRHDPVGYWGDVGGGALGCLVAPFVLIFQAITGLIALVVGWLVIVALVGTIVVVNHWESILGFLAVAAPAAIILVGLWFGLDEWRLSRSLRLQVDKSSIFKNTKDPRLETFPWKPIIEIAQEAGGMGSEGESSSNLREFCRRNWKDITRRESFAQRVSEPLWAWAHDEAKRAGYRSSDSLYRVLQGWFGEYFFLHSSNRADFLARFPNNALMVAEDQILIGQLDVISHGLDGDLPTLKDTVSETKKFISLNELSPGSFLGADAKSLISDAERRIEALECASTILRYLEDGDSAGAKATYLASPGLMGVDHPIVRTVKCELLGNQRQLSDAGRST